MHFIGFICVLSNLFCGFNEPHYFYINKLKHRNHETLPIRQQSRQF